MKEAHIVVPKMEVPPILRDVKVFKIPTKTPRYYKKKIRQMKRGLL